jgi:hypothetical protein
MNSTRPKSAGIDAQRTNHVMSAHLRTRNCKAPQHTALHDASGAPRNGAYVLHPATHRMVTSGQLYFCDWQTPVCSTAWLSVSQGDEVGFASHSPPSTTMIAPVIHAPPGDARNATMLAMSVGEPHRCSGIIFFA